MSLRACLMMFLAGIVGAGCPLRKDAVAPGDGGLDRPNTNDVATPADKPSDSMNMVDQMSAVGGNGNTATGGSDGFAGAGGISGTATGGSGAIGGGPDSGGGGITGGADCLAGSTRLCKDDPDLQPLGNCGAGQEACLAGHWGPCSVQPAAKDGCALVGDDATCNGRPNEGCPCVDGATQPCGPAADTGICKRGTQTCTGAAWGACVGAVYAAARDCTSSADNNCDGAPDNALDAVCVCAGATMRPCSEHVGKDGTGRCKAGTQSCVVATDKKASDWGACTGSVAPAAMDTCDPGNDDNCNGVPNEGCGCVTGATQACGPSANVGICKRGTQTCTAGAWGACVGAVQATARDCTSSADNNCDGSPDNTVDAVCGCASGATQACNQHPGKDGKGPCKAGSQTCVVATDKKSSAWGTCTGAVGPAAADTCDSGNDANCSGTANDGCACINGSTKACACGTPQSCSNGMLVGACTVCSGSTPVCLNGSTCVGCTSDANCAGTTRASCDTTTHTCVCRRKSAGNLLMNPGFDTAAQVVGNGNWIDPDPVNGSVWTSADADGCPESGSAFGDLYAVSNCVPVTPGVTYYFGLKYKNVSDPSLRCYLVAYASAGCSPSDPVSVMGPVLTFSTPTAAWQSSPSSSWVIPVGVNFAVFGCFGSSTDAEEYIDQVYMNKSSLTGF